MSEIDIYKHIGQQMISDREKIKELEERINKAILFIEEMYDETDSDNYDILRKEKEFLLKWLRGDKEWYLII